MKKITRRFLCLTVRLVKRFLAKNLASQNFLENFVCLGSAILYCCAAIEGGECLEKCQMAAR